MDQCLLQGGAICRPHCSSLHGLLTVLESCQVHVNPMYQFRCGTCWVHIHCKFFIAEAEAHQRVQQLQQRDDERESLKAQLQSRQAELESRDAEITSLREVGLLVISISSCLAHTCADKGDPVSRR